MRAKRPKTPLTELFRANLLAAIKADREIQSQNKLSDVLRRRGTVVAQASISRILSGQQSPTLDMVARLAEGFDYTPWQMLVADFEPTNRPTIRKNDQRLNALYQRAHIAMQQLAEYKINATKDPP
jgi:transcriptional regulator with XRE-family HTH domain